MNKAAIKNFAVWARNKLIADIKYKAGLIGITEKGIAPALPQSTKEVQFFDIGTRDYATVRGEEIRQRNAFVAAIREKEREVGYADAFQFVVEKVAYTWFNRLIAIRFMEINDYLPSRVRVLSSELPNKAEPDMVTKPFDLDLDFSAVDQDEIMQLKDENKLDELFRKLFLMQCYKLHEILPRLFDKDPRKTSDRSRSYFDLLLTISFTDQDGVLCHLVNDIREQDFRILTAEDLERQKIENIPDEEMPAGQVAIIGWLYQFYNTEPKDQVFAGLKKNIKITKDKIPAATQLFTPDWIVRYMVENSLGRLWMEGHPEAAKFLPDRNANGSVRVQEGRWNYYLEEAEQEPEVQAQLAELRKEYAALRPEDLKVIDPCMGSGHILVYLFDVLMQIYENLGWTQREAVRSILENNLYGLDIDERAAQLAYFAVMMKARQYDRRFLTRRCDNGEPDIPAIHVYEIRESGFTDAKGRAVHHITEDLIDYFANGNKALKRDMEAIAEDLFDAKEYGSLLNVRMVDFPALYARFEEIREDISLYQKPALEILLPLVERAEAMAQKYHVVVTNPPYLSSGSMNDTLLKYVKKEYSLAKNDTYSSFILKCREMINYNYFYSMITMQGWMFTQRFEELRRVLLKDSLCSMLHIGYNTFPELNSKIAQGTSFSFIKGKIPNLNTKYYDLTNNIPQNSNKKDVFEEKIANNSYICFANNKFQCLPGEQFAYWISSVLLKDFEKAKKLGDIASPRQGLATGDNDSFLRIWFEINNQKIGFGFESTDAFHKSRKLYAPYNKGGEYRKWYGNRDLVIKFDGYHYDLLNKQGNHLPSKQYFFSESATWSALTTSGFSCRYCEKGFVFDTKGSSCFCDNINELFTYMGFLNSVVANEIFKMLSPTVDYNAGTIANAPILINNNSIVNLLVKECINIAKENWDSFETSWDFQCHPLVRWSTCLQDATSIGATIHAYYGKHVPASCPLELCYLLWQGECNQRFTQLKANEEQLNRIFIDLYGLQDELTPEVEDRDVTVRKADLQRDIRSLISYAVGCMFGRYSLDVDGLAYAGGAWDAGKYTSFQPDPDNCIPITDEAYFEDDIVGRFVEFIRVVYGADTLNENLAFIAKALGNKGNSSREVIRNYFLKDFFKDHCKIYQKRPIYWLFDSGKQNGFKALVYLHRWNADTVGNLRVEYLHRVQKVYEREIQRMQDTMDNSRNNREVNQAAKRREKLVKQLKEARDYDARIAHVALSRVDIDLDDGVKVNYQKVQQGPDGKSLGILAKI